MTGRKDEEPFPKSHWTTEPEPGSRPVASSWTSTGEHTTYYSTDPREHADAEARMRKLYDIIFDGIAQALNRSGVDESLGVGLTARDLKEMAREMDEREEGTGTTWLSGLIAAYLGGGERPESVPTPKRKGKRQAAAGGDGHEEGAR